ncbi:hypothetical protein AVEN_172126-1 [Araneus ventricosus]|uniref:Uncharacterized protein n=1 Tax=Araneus ventricosus TaxID=182803 RepID=A0A4Y2JKD8_ARAVE|nr:hypothetical protein AVEN_29659-1 [Araneus ventricosus]GBM90404.1 hypothetical protein AVEN_172126-1 [Araneus ventricosus]
MVFTCTRIDRSTNGQPVDVFGRKFDTDLQCLTWCTKITRMRSRRISKRVLSPGPWYNNGGGSPSAIDNASLLPEGSGCGR